MSPEQARAHIAALDGLETRVRNMALVTTDLELLMRLSLEQQALRAAKRALAATESVRLELVR